AVLGAGVAFLVALVGSIAYLLTRKLEWDRITQASVEVGIILGAALTLAGAIWAKPTWNTYWTWDPR
ncbi:MAG: cytochrome c biogenesis protein CcsA, partial [Caldilineaceae bacterium]|nr:cytochrome c biogenesis protein CcsA [Caldilineaceae bacterium]